MPSKPTLVVEARAATDDRQDLQRMRKEIVGVLNRHHASYTHAYIEDQEQPPMPGTPTGPVATLPALVVTPMLVQAFDVAYRAHLQEEAKAPSKRNPLPTVQVHAQAEVLGYMLRMSGVPNVPTDDPADVLAALQGLLRDKPDPQRAAVHVTHCCSRHGCKYGEREYCPVASNLLAQKYPCEQCDEDAREAARAREDVHAARAGGAWTACGRRVADDDVQVAIQDYRVHVTCVDCRDEAGL